MGTGRILIDDDEDYGDDPDTDDDDGFSESESNWASEDQEEFWDGF